VKVGDPLVSDVQVGAVTTDKQLENHRGACRRRTSGRGEGRARRLAHGCTRVEPTVVSYVTERCVIDLQRDVLDQAQS